jgi:hypothetical protein
VDVYEQEFLGWFQTYMRGILALKEVFFGFLAFTTDWTERRTQKVEEVIRLANHHLGTRGLPISVSDGGDKNEIWHWKARQNQTLTWIT